MRHERDLGLETRDLELIIAIDEAGSILGAAGTLHVAQPALSRRLQRIEDDLGLRLFARDRHGAVSTAAGRAVITSARAALGAVRGVTSTARDAREGIRGVIRLGTTPTLGADVLPGILAEHHRSHPDLRIELEVSGNSPDLIGKLGRGSLDCVVAVRPRLVAPYVRMAAQGGQPFAVVCPSDLPAARQDPIPGPLLAEVEFVSVPTGQGLRELLDEVLASVGAVPRIGIETSEREMLVPLAAAGFGAILVPRTFAEQRRVEGLVVRDLDPPVTRPIGVFVRKGRLDPLVRTLTDLFTPDVWI
ncbi:MAG: LysR family transcriptional regulator [Acidimicrobiia bacterium]|nr:LysR family transcriptional regulator [Acidimicrobiia bacterium]